MESWFLDNEMKLIFFVEKRVNLNMGDYVNLGTREVANNVEIKEIVYEPTINVICYYINISLTNDEIEEICMRVYQSLGASEV